MNISKQIKYFRERNQLSQEELANKIYVSRQTISNWENERSYPDIHNLLLLSVLFDVSLDELVKGDIDVMKESVKRSNLNYLGYSMVICMVLMSISIAPAFKFWGLPGLVIPVIFAIGMFVSAFAVEKIKKTNNLETYSEILAYMNNNKADTEKIESERKNKTGKSVLKAGASAILAIVLIAINFLLFF